jgi:cation diffusion facilitator CzcD-associated flavoprotein CzcO
MSSTTVKIAEAPGAGPDGDPRIHRVAVIGTGFAGLGMSIELLRVGIEDFVVFERASSVGGTWRDNTYPGCACDVPSHLYSLSFAPNPDWSRSFSPQPEIWAYLKRTAERSGVLPHVRFDCEVTDARWNDDDKHWILQTPQGEFRSRVLIAGIGGLIEPKSPDVPGLSGFGGEVFHSARWNHDYDLEGKRVAVIGTGASSIQFVPKIQPKVAELHLFQRTPAWIAPRADRRISERRKRLYRRFPVTQRLSRSMIFWAREALGYAFIKNPKAMRLVERAAKRHIANQVDDPELRRKLTPDYTFGCKRALISNDFYPAVAKPNVELLTEGLAEVRGNTVIGSDGTEREVDAIILGTGFDVTGFPGAAIIHGRDARSLTELWDGSPSAHRCTTVHGYPNFFILGGPNFGTGHMSAVQMVEHQYSYVLDALAQIDRDGIASFDVRLDAQQRFIAEIDRKMAATVWTIGGCQSWYVDRTGRNSTLWPDWTFEHAKATERFDPAEYEVEGGRDRKAAPAVPA